MKEAFVQDLERFRGNGGKNRQGKTLEEFISVYDPKKYDCPSNTVDMVVLKSSGPYKDPSQPLKVLMVKRSNHPSIGWWALPGGFVNLKEDIDHAAFRELEEETGVRDLPMVQLKTWGAWDRDPRWRVITTAYLALVEGELPVRAGDDAADALWFDLDLTETGSEFSDEPKAEKTVKYELKLVNDEAGLKLSASLTRTTIKRGPLTDVRYELCSSDGIAVDHGLILSDAVLYLMDACQTDTAFV